MSITYFASLWVLSFHTLGRELPIVWLPHPWLDAASHERPGDTAQQQIVLSLLLDFFPKSFNNPLKWQPS